MIAYHHRRARHRLWLRTRADRRQACSVLLDALEAHSRLAVLRWKRQPQAVARRA
jgi:hypothetical protein